MSDRYTTEINIARRIEFWDGFRFAWGVVAFMGVALIAAHILDLASPRDYDDSDQPPSRSGLCIRTDAKTGCEYFMTPSGSITPRMAADGKQVCR